MWGIEVPSPFISPRSLTLLRFLNLINITFEIDEKTLEEILEKKAWKGKLPCNATIIDKKKERLKKIRKQGGHLLEKNNALTWKTNPDLVKIVTTWNDLSNSNEWGDERNKLLHIPPTDAFIKIFEKAVKKLTIIDIIEDIELYYSYCKEGLHVSNGTNYAYKDLTTFLKKLLEKNPKKWWRKDLTTRSPVVDDRYPKITQRLIDLYGDIILGSHGYSGNADRHHFIKTAKVLKKIFDKNKAELGITLSSFLEYYMESVNDNFMDTVSPSQLHSSHIVTILLPQKLKTYFPNVRLKI